MSERGISRFIPERVRKDAEEYAEKVVDDRGFGDDTGRTREERVAHEKRCFISEWVVETEFEARGHTLWTLGDVHVCDFVVDDGERVEVKSALMGSADNIPLRNTNIPDSVVHVVVSEDLTLAVIVGGHLYDYLNTFADPLHVGEKSDELEKKLASKDRLLSFDAWAEAVLEQPSGVAQEVGA